MNIENRAVFISGANRGIGKATVDALLKHKVKRVYAAARHVDQLSFNDPRVVPVELDITNQAQVAAAAEKAGDTDILINNAGVLSFATVIDGEPDEIVHDMMVNYLGTLRMARAFVPVLEQREEAAIVNVCSVVALASAPGIGGYSASKAALFSATQSMRTELSDTTISVYGVFPGPIDTDMTKGFEMSKASPQSTGENIVKGIIAGNDYIFPDAMSVEMGALWAKDPRGLEKKMAGS